MLTLFKKEINGFLNSLIGYIVMIVFLLMTGLFLWVFPLEFNVLEGSVLKTYLTDWMNSGILVPPPINSIL